MFSVGLLYSCRDFLKLIPESGMTPDSFKTYFKTYKYSTADKILQVAFKCGWSKLTQNGIIELTERGHLIIGHEYQPALLLQLEDLILNFNPVWASLIIKGRSEAKNFLPQDAYQCFKECGLFGELSDDLIRYWDNLALAYRNYSQKQMVEIGRSGERLSIDYERRRTGINPIWQSIESNLSGFDILSIIDKEDSKKLMIEVKSTTSNLNYAKLHISNNEWNTASSSINYVFHLWHINESPTLYVIPIEKISTHISSNRGDGKWESIEIPFKALI
ncbi:MAG: DUF3883 domain-containing protein [Bacteroidetes bacterium]|nr:MAG: DUF3883 domain-containing protein [Bacteroidota bacterium]